MARCNLSWLVSPIIPTQPGSEPPGSTPAAPDVEAGINAASIWRATFVSEPQARSPHDGQPHGSASFHGRHAVSLYTKSESSTAAGATPHANGSEAGLATCPHDERTTSPATSIKQWRRSGLLPKHWNRSSSTTHASEIQ